MNIYSFVLLLNSIIENNMETLRDIHVFSMSFPLYLCVSLRQAYFVYNVYIIMDTKWTNMSRCDKGDRKKVGRLNDHKKCLAIITVIIYNVYWTFPLNYFCSNYATDLLMLHFYFNSFLHALLEQVFKF